MTIEKKGTPTKSAIPNHVHGEIVTPAGRLGKLLELIRQHPVTTLELATAHAYTDAYVDVRRLRAMGFNIQTTILPSFVFRGEVRKGIALYSMGFPEWEDPDRL